MKINPHLVNECCCDELLSNQLILHRLPGEIVNISSVDESLLEHTKLSILKGYMFKQAVYYTLLSTIFTLNLHASNTQ